MQLTYVNKRNGHVLNFQNCRCSFRGWNSHAKNVSLWRDVVFVQDCGNVVQVVSKDFVVLQRLFRCHYFLDQGLVPNLKSKVANATVTWPFKVQRIFSPAKIRNLDEVSFKCEFYRFSLVYLPIYVTFKLFSILLQIHRSPLFKVRQFQNVSQSRQTVRSNPIFKPGDLLFREFNVMDHPDVADQSGFSRISRS